MTIQTLKILSTMVGAGMIYVLLVVAGLVVALALDVLRALIIAEICAQIRRRTRASVERTIASMPTQLQAEWANKWRAKLAALESMPLSAIAFARGLRQTAGQLVTTLEPAPVKPGHTSWQSSRGKALARLLVATFGFGGSAQAKLVGRYTKFAQYPYASL